MNPFLLSALLIFSYMCLLFLLSRLLKSYTILDIGWGLGFILVAFATFFFLSNLRLHQKLLTFLTLIWGLRLSLSLLIRDWGKAEDIRFIEMRKKWGNNEMLYSFFELFMLRGLLMFICTLPVVVVNSTAYVNKDWAWMYPLGSFFGLVGFFFESVGDWQLYMFQTNPHKHGIMQTGLWKYSQHPNYFGQAVQAWCMFFLAAPSGSSYITILAPLIITFLLVKISTSKLPAEKYQANQVYEAYKKRTNAFLPWYPGPAV
jgi:steroid 5-alpha reductase family enzyme